MKVKNKTVKITPEELLALAPLTGEAVRLYITIKSFIPKGGRHCYAGWAHISKAMGKRKADTRSLQRLTKQLEAASLIKRYQIDDEWTFKILSRTTIAYMKEI